MSLETANKGASVVRIAHDWTSLLEILAFSIHPGTSENVSSMCLFNSTVLITSQANLEFNGIDQNTLKTKLDELQWLTLSRLDQNKKIEDWWVNHCVISTTIGNKYTATGQQRTKKTISQANQKINLLKANIYIPMMERLFSEDELLTAPSIKKLRDTIMETVVVLNKDIFDIAPELTGFHGESRILRYLFIEWARHFIFTNSENLSDKVRTRVVKSRGDSTTDAKNARVELIQSMEKKFIKRIKQWSLKFGSSQATCVDCSKALDICGAAHGPAGNQSPQWRDPLDFSGVQTSSRIKAVYRHHALNFALKNFDDWEPMEDGDLDLSESMDY